MSKGSSLIIILVVLVVGIAIGAGIYYFLNQFQPFNQYGEDNQNDSTTIADQKAEHQKFLDENFPDIVSGTLNLSILSPTIKTDDGKEYMLWPKFSREDYEENGFKDGQRVQFQGQILPKDEKNKIMQERLFISTPDVLPK